MAYPVTIGSILECSIVGKLDGQVCMTVLHYRITNASTLTNGDTLLGDVAGVLNAANGLIQKYANCLVETYEITDLRLQWVSPTRYHYRSFAPIASAGTVAEIPSPINVSAAITKRAETTGREAHGNVHMPGVPSTFITASEINATGLLAYSALADKIDDVLTVGSTDTYEPVIYHRPEPNLSKKVFDCSVHTEARVQRRRTVGLGI